MRSPCRIGDSLPSATKHRKTPIHSDLEKNYYNICIGKWNFQARVGLVCFLNKTTDRTVFSEQWEKANKKWSYMLFPPADTCRKIFTFARTSKSLSFLYVIVLLTKIFTPALRFQHYGNRDLRRHQISFCLQKSGGLDEDEYVTPRRAEISLVCTWKETGEIEGVILVPEPETLEGK